MNDALIAALGALALAAVSALTVWVRVAQQRMEEELKRNTLLTKRAAEEAQTAAAQTGETVADLRNKLQTYMGLVEVYRDMVRYVQSTPQGAEILSRYQDRRRSIVHDDALAELEQRLLREARRHG